MRRRTLLAVASLLPAACAAPSAPMRPAAQPRLDIERFYKLDPAMLRAAVLSDSRALFLAVDLDLTVQSPESARYVIRLQRPLAIDSRLPPAPEGQSWRVFGLTAADVATLATVQQLLTSQREQAGNVDIAVSARPALVPADLAGALPLRIDLLVDPREGWFTQVGPVLLDTRATNAKPSG
jgi:hypothetical protein